jgi:hypothetical protein
MEIDDLLGRYLLAAAEHAQLVSSGGGQPRTRAVNRAADELRRLASIIGSGGPDSIRSFSSLLDETRNDVRIWAAFHALEVMQSPPDVVDRAFCVLEERANGDGVNALGTRMRLNELRAQFGRNSPTA